MSVLDLSGAWRLSYIPERADAPIGAVENVPCAVPGDGHGALLAAGLIPDPYRGRSELAVQSLGRGEWRFEKDFDFAPALPAASAPAGAFLHFDSIDAVAEVRLNGVVLAVSANQFRRVRAAAGGALRIGRNRLEVVCRSAEIEAERRAASLPYPIPISFYPVQSPHRNLVRKAQCHSGWDWGPCLMTAGIYGRVYLGYGEAGRIEYLSARTLRSAGGGVWRVVAEIDYFLEGGGAAGPAVAARLDLDLSDPDGRRVAGATLSRLTLAPGPNRLTAELEVADPRLWWPAGYGLQPLYRLEARVALEGEPAPEGAAVGSAALRLGFRELEVVADADAIGRSLTFVVNGRPVWAKGANWIPADSLPGRQTAERVRGLLGAALAANMNMIRVWGGGQYESDAFYDYCDEQGILVWQDMMFACSMYPADPDFLADVRAEVAHQVKRLKHRPSLAIWCGNNENVGALNWYPETRAFRDRYLIDYDRLNEGAVGSTVRALDPDRAWWPSSPSAGPADFSDCWHGDGKGDMHYWSVWHEGKPFEAYYSVAPRFCSEFGYQSFPSPSGIAAYCPPDERNLTSPTMEHHQKNPRGNSIIIENFSRYYRFPTGFEAMLYLSQVQQAQAIRTAVDYWRSLRPVCMGALYWQLNDCWPVASWSSLEYSGKWKLLHYAAKRFFAPLAVVAFLKEGRVYVKLVSDLATPVGAAAAVRLVDFAGAELWRRDFRLTAAADAATPLWEAALADLPALAGAASPAGDSAGFAAAAFLVAELSPDPAALAAAGAAAGLAPGVLPDVAARAELFLAEPKRCSLADPRLEYGLADGPGGPTVSLRAAAPAFAVALDAGGLAGRWEDNGFTLLAGEMRVLRWIPDSGAPAPDAAALGAALAVRHLRE
jgi:beta-mannosidase